MLGWGLAGAALLALAAYAVARMLAGGASSFALLAFMVEDYIAERIRAANAFDAHYATLPDFTLELRHVDPTRQPLSRFTFDAASLNTRGARTLLTPVWRGCFTPLHPRPVG